MNEMNFKLHNQLEKFKQLRKLKQLNKLGYIGYVRLHICTNPDCYPPTWCSSSQFSIPCPDCSSPSRIATIEEEDRHRDDMTYPTSEESIEFMLGGNPVISGRAFMNNF